MLYEHVIDLICTGSLTPMNAHIEMRSWCTVVGVGMGVGVDTSAYGALEWRSFRTQYINISIYISIYIR